MIGCPYAQAGVSPTGQATSTCPICDEVFEASNHKASGRKYATHYVKKHTTPS